MGNKTTKGDKTNANAKSSPTSSSCGSCFRISKKSKGNGGGAAARPYFFKFKKLISPEKARIKRSLNKAIYLSKDYFTGLKLAANEHFKGYKINAGQFFVKERPTRIAFKDRYSFLAFQDGEGYILVNNYKIVQIKFDQRQYFDVIFHKDFYYIHTSEGPDTCPYICRITQQGEESKQKFCPKLVDEQQHISNIPKSFGVFPDDENKLAIFLGNYFKDYSVEPILSVKHSESARGSLRNAQKAYLFYLNLSSPLVEYFPKENYVATNEETPLFKFEKIKHFFCMSNSKVLIFTAYGYSLVELDWGYMMETRVWGGEELETRGLKMTSSPDHVAICPKEDMLVMALNIVDYVESGHQGTNKFLNVIEIYEMKLFRKRLYFEVFRGWGNNNRISGIWIHGYKKDYLAVSGVWDDDELELGGEAKRVFTFVYHIRSRKVVKFCLRRIDDFGRIRCVRRLGSDLFGIDENGKRFAIFF